MNNVQLKKHPKSLETSELTALSKEELLVKVQKLQAHNVQLKNILAKGQSEVTEPTQWKNKKQFDFTKCSFRHILLKFFYLGWDYHGYVVQEDTSNTIENHLFTALTKTCLIKDRTSSNYHRCGRTDKGVSSFGQTVSLDVRSKLLESEQHDVKNELEYCSLLNKVLPDNIQCVGWCPVDNNFSARFDCKGRTYKYFFPKGNLNIEKMREASKYLLGTHDFRNLCKMDVGNGVVEFIRNIKNMEIERVNESGAAESEYSMYAVTIKGQAYLWHQIRCIMGILFLIGENKEEPEIIKELLDVKTNPRKPDYSMASEVPLNLFHCDYDLPTNWIYDEATIKAVVMKLKDMWTFYNIKTTMLKSMLDTLPCKEAHNEDPHSSRSNCLLPGIKMKTYIPLMKRQKCDSLENKIEHFVKRSRLEIVEKNNKSD